MKYCIKVQNETYPIAEDEIEKVLEAIDTGRPVLLKAGVFKGSYISSVVRDIHAEKGWNYGYKPTGGDGLVRSDYVTDIPERLSDHKLLS